MFLGRRRAFSGRVFPVLLMLGFAALLAVLPLFPAPAQAAGTTSVHVVKYASDGKTVIRETTVDYQWMEEHLPVQGDGTTHYYHQGPTFDENNLWDPSETVNLKDHGALRGTDLKDLCDLVGGMQAGDAVKVKAADGFYKKFPFENVYHPLPRQGPIVLCWWKDGEYVPGFSEGIRLVFFARTPNQRGRYVFGNQDMRQCFAESYWHLFDNHWPSSNGYTVQNVNEVIILSSEAPPTQTLVVVVITLLAVGGLAAGVVFLRRNRRGKGGG
ncbi:MAG: argininosuccinate synthase [Clostridia bacterium]|jgi:hypothetical protein|nr:argininosuccinate synthase [Clostridia bacterium]MDH7573841.1 argininosuccinate synthase [Clostridia bacterium]